MPTHRTFIATYIMASGRNGTLYTGMTANLEARVWKHRSGVFDGFSHAHDRTRLVWFERHAWVVEAIAREKRIKKWLRDWKLKLIEDGNPDWRDLAEGWYPVNDPNWRPQWKIDFRHPPASGARPGDPAARESANLSRTRCPNITSRMDRLRRRWVPRSAPRRCGLPEDDEKGVAILSAQNHPNVFNPILSTSVLLLPALQNRAILFPLVRIGRAAQPGRADLRRIALFRRCFSRRRV